LRLPRRSPSRPAGRARARAGRAAGPAAGPAAARARARRRAAPEAAARPAPAAEAAEAAADTGTEPRRVAPRARGTPSRGGLWAHSDQNPPRSGIWGAVALLAALAALAGCGGGGAGAAGPSAAQALHTYVARIEPLRLAVNRLLDRADPILGAYREKRIGGTVARRRFDRLERRFAGYAARIAAIRAPAELRRAAAAYAHTYVFEDSYLSALTAALPDRSFDELPHTAERQRRAIIAWRIRLEVVARRLGVRLPADLQQAGRGEIAPSPEGS